MLTLLRRLLVVIALMFWQGGFTFYASVVVPIGQQVLHTHFNQGMITRRVTVYLNLAGAVALLPLIWDAAVTRERLAVWRWLRWLCVAGMVAGLGLLVWLHPQLDTLIDTETERLLDRRAFRGGHRWYLWISTVQWGCALVYAALALHAWRNADRTAGAAEAADAQ